MSDELWQMSAVQQARLVQTKKASAREMLASHLARIDEVNETLKAVVGMDASVAEATASKIDETIASGGKVGPLAGLITAHKDLTDTADFVTTYGSTTYAGHRPTKNALLVDMMAAAGAVAIGKTNTPEFGAGSHTFNRVYGTTRNPYNTELTAGGSSGGAAVALRAGMVSLADGSDLGGSLRNPAAWNNVVGFRNSPGVVPGVGSRNAWNPMPIQGPMARSVDDLVMMLRVLAQYNPADPLSQQLLLPPSISPPRRAPRVAWSRDLGGLPIEQEILDVLDTFRSDMDVLGWEITDAEPDFTGADEAFITLRAFLFAERAEAMASQMSELKDTLRDEIERGVALTGAEIVAAYTQLDTIRKRALNFFGDYDLLIAPVTQVSPFPFDVEYPTEVNGMPMGSYVEWMRSCCRITATGCPAMSLPGGFTADGMPVGVQLIAAPNTDVGLLEAAKAIEATTGHGARGPDL
jgi:amidase